MDRRLKLRHFQCFLSAARSRYLREAATALNITQAAVTKTLNELEEIVGHRLVVRDRSGVKLTHQGELFFHYAAAGMASLEQGYDGLQADPSAPRIEVRLGVLPTVAARFLPRATSRFLEETRRSVNFSLLTGHNQHLLELLHRGKVDLVVARIGSPDDMQQLEFKHLYAEPLVLVARAGHPLCQSGGVRLRDVSGYPFLLPPVGTRIRPLVEQALTNLGIPMPGTVIETVSNTFGRSFLRGSDAVWMISYGVVEDYIEAGLLSLLADPIENTSDPVGVIRRKDQEMDAATRQITQILLSQTRHLRPLGQ
ncbi:pca operon transcription factor PcaQ [Alloalcanivorax gelatiniphagus]|uniref:Pca operon transcription factor PcaQ n=1 Tax=Alloalcanivorax gelatiniphagus TaxID=1194167 RepID=A0ABY2XNN9_9GAMM|nr:pca operon transcription factor PcaQ [Alloalcanivorax gelatiniphagus]TMW14081.1 pca operon transcription factor PcaQ [Alloalcanivorax gelatiniphagus]